MSSSPGASGKMEQNLRGTCACTSCKWLWDLGEELVGDAVWWVGGGCWCRTEVPAAPSPSRGTAPPFCVSTAPAAAEPWRGWGWMFFSVRRRRDWCWAAGWCIGEGKGEEVRQVELRGASAWEGVRRAGDRPGALGKCCPLWTVCARHWRNVWCPV